MPARWFATTGRGRGTAITLNLPSGASVIQRRARTGKPFKATVKSHTGVFRRAARPARRETALGEPTWLPIVEEMVNTARPSYRVREDVLVHLAKRFPKEYNRRMSLELRKAFRG